MTISPLTNQAYVTSQKSSRNGATVDHFLVHHAVSTNWHAVLDLMMGAKEVSANYIIGNGGEIISVVPEEYRAWTSSSAAWDGRSITVEVCNSALNGGAANDPDGYPISPAAQDALQRLIADVGRRYGFTPIRDGLNSTVLSHRDLADWFGDSYGTQCPGGFIWYRLPAIAARAVEINSGGANVAPQIGDKTMFNGRHPNGAITAFGEVTSTGLSGGIWAYYQKAFGPYVQLTKEEYEQEFINVKARKAQLLGNAYTDEDAATARAGMDSYFKAFEKSIAELNAAITSPKPAKP